MPTRTRVPGRYTWSSRWRTEPAFRSVGQAPRYAGRVREMWIVDLEGGCVEVARQPSPRLRPRRAARTGRHPGARGVPRACRSRSTTSSADRGVGCSRVLSRRGRRAGGPAAEMSLHAAHTSWGMTPHRMRWPNTQQPAQKPTTDSSRANTSSTATSTSAAPVQPSARPRSEATVVSVSPTAWANRLGGPGHELGRPEPRGDDLGGEAAEQAEPRAGQHPGEEAEGDQRDEPQPPGREGHRRRRRPPRPPRRGRPSR